MLTSVLLFVSVGQVTITTADMKQYFIREPDNQTAIEGEQVTLPCRVENKIGLLQWTRDGFGLGDTRALVGYSRYRLVGSDDEKDWTLQISPVLLEDDALFQCQVGAANGIKPVRSRNAQLTVYVPPEDPYIVQGSVVEVTEDRETVLDCVSPGGKPAADIHWHDGDGHVISKSVHTSSTLLGDGKRFNTTSTLSFLPKKKHHNRTFTCSASNIADRSRRSVSVLLLVRYAPSVRITTSHNIGLLTEGETVQFKCHAHANPPPESYTWYVDGQKANGYEHDFFVIRNISQNYHRSIVKCEVTNQIGKSEETETIQVRYSPKIITQPQTVSGDLGDTVSLHCAVDSNPPPTYQWTKGTSRQAVGSSQNLTVIVSQRTEGQYFCHSITDGFDLLTTQPASILLQGRPSINSAKTQTGETGSTVELECGATAAPRAQALIWTYMGRTITSGDPKYEILLNKSGYQIQSTLLVRNTDSNDFGYYGCTVTNERGSDEISIHLEMEEVFPMLIILIGVFATIIVLLLATLLFLLCRRRFCSNCSPSLDKPVKQNNLQSVCPPRSEEKTLSVCEEEGWEDGEGGDGLYSHRLSRYSGHDFPPKPDLISSGYVPYGSYVRDYPLPPSQANNFPPSDSQTSLHSASQLAQTNANNRQSTILNVSDPRYSATYGNPYLRSPQKTSHYSTFSPTDPPCPTSILSPASTINSSLSYTRSVLTPPLQSGAGGSVMGIGPHSPQLHHRHPQSGDLYAVVSKPGAPGPVISFRNNLNGGHSTTHTGGWTPGGGGGPLGTSSPMQGVKGIPQHATSLTAMDQSCISTLSESTPSNTTIPTHQYSPSPHPTAQYILDSGPASSVSSGDTGTHV